VYPHGITQLPLDRFLRKFYTGDYSSNITKKIMLVQTQKKISGTLYINTYVLSQYLAYLFQK
jgi:hypothetical protein